MCFRYYRKNNTAFRNFKNSFSKIIFVFFVQLFNINLFCLCYYDTDAIFSLFFSTKKKTPSIVMTLALHVIYNNKKKQQFATIAIEPNKQFIKH